MNFGQAIESLKSGKKVARGGWNGRGMFLFFQKGYPQGVPANRNTAEALGVPEGAPVKVLPYIAMSTVDASIVPWLASQTDVLAEDWSEVG